MTKTLYKRNKNDSVQLWTVEVDSDKGAWRVSAGKQGGKIFVHEWTYCTPKNVGKANETTPAQQAQLEADAEYIKKLKQNYFENVSDIDKKWLEPQLAKPCADYLDKVDWVGGQIVDHKLNGIACIITRNGAVSRKNETFYSIPHILEDLQPFFEVYPDAYLQGELFNPAYISNLNRIAKLVAVTRKPKDITPELLAESKLMVEFHVYDGYGFDGITVDCDGLKRRSKLAYHFDCGRGLGHTCKFWYKYCTIVDYDYLRSFEELQVFAQKYMDEGGEGVIIRNPKAPYQHKRTKDLLKFKRMEDEEFTILRFEEAKGNWAGCTKAVWCALPNGKREKEFKTNIEGDRKFLKEVWQNQNKYIGKRITVRYQGLSEFNTPQIPYTDLTIRDEYEGK